MAAYSTTTVRNPRCPHLKRKVRLQTPQSIAQKAYSLTCSKVAQDVALPHRPVYHMRERLLLCSILDKAERMIKDCQQGVDAEEDARRRGYGVCTPMPSVLKYGSAPDNTSLPTSDSSSTRDISGTSNSGTKRQSDKSPSPLSHQISLPVLSRPPSRSPSPPLSPSSIASPSSPSPSISHLSSLALRLDLGTDKANENWQHQQPSHQSSHHLRTIPRSILAN